MWSVYIVKSKDHDWYYIGMSQNPFDRLKSHNSGKVRSTKYKKPYEILLIEEFDSLKKARTREKYYKTGFGKKVWMKRLKIIRVRGSQPAPDQQEGRRGIPESPQKNYFLINLHIPDNIK